MHISKPILHAITFLSKFIGFFSIIKSFCNNLESDSSTETLIEEYFVGKKGVFITSNISFSIVVALSFFEFFNAFISVRSRHLA